MPTWTTKLFLTLGVLGSLLLVVPLAGLGGALFWDREAARAEAQTREALPSLAIQQVPLIFGYDYQTVERSLDDAALLLTDAYRAEFKTRAAQEIIPQARQRKLVSQANVVGAGVLDAHRNTGSVLVFLNRTVTDDSKQPVYDGSRIRVDYQKVGGEWKIGYIAPI